MKLELKHIAPYLPYYPLTATSEDEHAKETVVTGEYSIMDCFVDCVLHDGFKMHLRPMSDLTKEITHNGETFVPARVLWSVEIKEEEAFDVYGTIPEYWKSNCEIKLKHLSYGDVQKLISWHFDVFDLIPNDLAIAKTN